MQTQATQTQEVAKVIILGKFNGAFANFQIAAFNDLKVAGLEASVSHLIATDYGSDLGNAMRNGTDFGSKVAKAKKNGESRISITGKGETKMSNAMLLIRYTQLVSAMRKESIVDSYECDWDALNNVGENSPFKYLSNIRARAKTLTFE